MTFCESFSEGCECRFYDSDTRKYLGFRREGELHPLNMPFAPDSVIREYGPFRHQDRGGRK